jgi:hypothetical protein
MVRILLRHRFRKTAYLRQHDGRISRIEATDAKRMSNIDNLLSIDTQTAIMATDRELAQSSHFQPKLSLIDRVLRIVWTGRYRLCHTRMSNSLISPLLCGRRSSCNWRRGSPSSWETCKWSMGSGCCGAFLPPNPKPWVKM